MVACWSAFGLTYYWLYRCMCSVCVKETSGWIAANKLCEKDDIISCIQTAWYRDKNLVRQKSRKTKISQNRNLARQKSCKTKILQRKKYYKTKTVQNNSKNAKIINYILLSSTIFSISKEYTWIFVSREMLVLRYFCLARFFIYIMSRVLLTFVPPPAIFWREYQTDNIIQWYIRIHTRVACTIR